MNNYHLYEEIGHGKYTVVYKGRKRYSIEYVGVKSTEKCRRSRVMNEVAVLNDIKGHFNVLRFNNWYETRNHLWIITEYCAGGDLLKVLKQDAKVSPDQCRAFCLDIVAGLHHVHRNGIIYGDLKPSNLLFTEEGRLKLCDFGMSQRLSDLENLSAKGKPLPRRGTPYYMAPELFLDRGVHSFASDLWALGIVMHELVTGRPPFVSNSFQSLQQLIKEEDPKPDITPLSSSMTDLVHGRGRGGDDGLLSKDPVTRLDWPRLLAHAFWKGQFDHLLEIVLPIQKHFVDYVNTTHRLHYPNSRREAVSMSTSSQRVNPLAVQTPSSEMLRSETPSVMGQPTPPTRCQTIQQLVFHPSTPSESRRATVAATISKLLPHWSDQSVSPISTILEDEGAVPPDSSSDFVDNEGIEAGSAGKENLRGWENRLPFKAYDREDFVVAITQSATSAVLNREVHHHIAVIHQHLRSAASPDLVHAIIQYLTHLAERVEIADVVLNSSILSLLLVLASPPADRDADHSGTKSRSWTIARRSEALRIDTLNMLGKALRHASFIEPGYTAAGGSHSMMVGVSVASHHSVEAALSRTSLDTVVSGAYGGYGLFEVLQQCIDPFNSPAIRRSALAALGELMFYVATQQTPAGSAQAVAADTTANSILSGCSSSSLELPPSVVSIVMQTCLIRSDDLELHGLLMLAAQTLRNIALMAPNGWVTANLLTPAIDAQVLSRLCRVCCDTTVSVGVRVTCLAALDDTPLSPWTATGKAILLRLDLVPTMRKLAATELLRVCVSGMQLAGQASAEADIQRAVSSAASFGLRLLSSHRIDATTAERLVIEALSILGQPRLSSVSRGKVLLLLARLFLIRGTSTDAIGAQALQLALEKGLAMRFDRICRAPDAARDEDSEDEDTASYLQRALSVIIDAVSICLWQCLADAVLELHSVATTSNPTPSPRYSSRSGSSSTSASSFSSSSSLRRGSSSSCQGTNISRALNIIMHLLANSNMARCVLTASHIPPVARIATWQTTCASPRSGIMSRQGTNAGLQHLQLLMIEGLPAQVGVILESGSSLCDCFVHNMLPAIISHTHSSLADVRFRAFKSLSDIIMQLLGDDDTYNADGALRARLASLLREQLLPLVGVLLGDDEPTPTLLRRLLALVMPDEEMTPMVKYRR